MNAFLSIDSGARRRSSARTTALLAVAGICAAAGSTAIGNSVTTGRIFGNAPSGATVMVSSSEFAIHRTMPVDANGRYLVTSLPIGVYEVTVIDHGQPRAKHPSVQVFVDGGSRVDFGCAYGPCSELAAN